VLTTKDLLDTAEALLNLSEDRGATPVVAEDRVLYALQSIAASQLVIARAAAGIRAK
jgi:hypothetical protein